MKTWIKILGGFAAAAVAVLLVPRLFERPGVPPMTALLLTGVLVGLATTSVLYVVVTRDLGLGRTVAGFAVGYNLLLVLVKFVLAPHGLYDVNQTDTFAIALDTDVEAALTAGGVLAIYAAVYCLLYLILRRRIAARARKLPGGAKVGIVVALLMGAIMFVAGGFIIALWVLFNLAEYLSFVFSSAVSLLMVAVIAGAITLATMALKDARDRAVAIGNAALLTNFFWVGLAFIAMYHALWVVFILTLTAIWPLKVVTPK